MESNSTQRISCADVNALLQRAKAGLLASLLLGGQKQGGFNFWQGQIAALTCLANGNAAFMAGKDALLPYEPPPMLRAAALALDIDAYRLPRAEILQRLAQAGVQITPDTVPGLNVIATHQFEHGAIPSVDLHHEHAALDVQIDDGASGHEKSFKSLGVDVQQAGIVTSQGGAA